jgi:hypothetical protein
VFVCELAEVIVARIVNVCWTDGVTVPTVHTPLFEAYVPWLGVADTNETPAGSKSCTVTVVAAAGPLSISFTVYVIVCPTVAVGLLTFFNSIRSACCTLVAVVSLLLLVFGSN